MVRKRRHWDESKHPRDRRGRFTDGEPTPSWVAKVDAQLRSHGMPTTSEARIAKTTARVDRLRKREDGPGTRRWADLLGQQMMGGGPPRSRRVAGGDVTEDMRPKAFETSQAMGLWGDPRLDDVIAKQAGWGHTAQVVDRADMDRAVATGWTEMWRGLTAGRNLEPAAEIAEQTRMGPWRAGRGSYGNGVYASTSRTTGEVFRGAQMPGALRQGPGDRWDDNGEWAGKWELGNAQPGSLMRMALDPDARVVDFEDLLDEHEEWVKAERLRADTVWLERLDREALIASNALLQIAQDPGVFAALRGYDAIRVGGRRGRVDGAPHGPNANPVQYVLLNRSVLMMEREDGSYDLPVEEER